MKKPPSRKAPYRVNTVQAKNRLNELIAQTNESKEPIVVEKRGEPVAVILDYASYQTDQAPKQKKSHDQFWRDLKAFHRHMEKKYPEGTGDSVEIIRQMREERARR